MSWKEQLFHLCCSFCCGLIKLGNKRILLDIVRDPVILLIFLPETVSEKGLVISSFWVFMYASSNSEHGGVCCPVSMTIV